MNLNQIFSRYVFFYFKVNNLTKLPIEYLLQTHQVAIPFSKILIFIITTKKRSFCSDGS
jgi:hypothetical protein